MPAPALQTFADTYAKARFRGSAPVLEAPGEFADTATVDKAKWTHFLEGVAKFKDGPKKPENGEGSSLPFGSAPSFGRNQILNFDGSPSIRTRTELADDAVLTEDLPRFPSHQPYIRQRTPKTLTFYMAADDGLQGSFAFVEGTAFQSMAGFVIFTNSIVIGFETDYDTPAWFWVEQGLLTFFCFELTLRLCRHGCNFFKHEDDWVWNLLDFGIVMSGVFDQWAMPAVRYLTSVASVHKEDEDSKMSMVFMLMRMLRLLRIIRLFRLVRMVRPLYNLAVGVLEAMQGMFWVLVFMVMTLYATGILCTTFIGKGAALSEDMKADEEIQEIMLMFGTVPDSMFSLFGTVSSWSLLKFAPLFEKTPLLRPMFVLFYVYSAWALLAVMTGVVSENLCAIRDQMIRDEEERENLRKANITKTLTELFIEADADQSGEVDRDEFDTMLVNPKLSALLGKNTNIRVHDLLDLFAWIDQDKSGTIAVDEFMMGFKWINEPLSAKSLVKLHDRLMQEFKSLETNIENTMGGQKYSGLHSSTTQPLRKIHAVSEQIDHLGEVCSTLKFNLQEASAWVPTMRQVSRTELNLHEKMDKVFQRINKLQTWAQKHA